MMFEKEKEIHAERNPVLKVFRRFFNVTEDYAGGKFMVEREGRHWATPLLIVLLLVESTDVLFATDSIPAVLAITTDPFIVYTSNVFAILGLRSLFFALAGLMKLFHYLNYGLAAVLMFIGVKMLAEMKYHIPTWMALLVIAVVLTRSEEHTSELQSLTNLSPFPYTTLFRSHSSCTRQTCLPFWACGRCSSRSPA